MKPSLQVPKTVEEKHLTAPEERAQHFLKLVEAYGYWLASPEENAAVGMGVNWKGLHD